MRARNIKPSFFCNDILAECEPLARLLFIGLWGVADREGRLLDRPKKIKVQVLPYDNCDPNKLLNDLQKQGFILRYSLEDNSYIQILNFQKHQNPHVKEAPSTIPAPDKHNTSMVRNVPLTESFLLNPESPILNISALASTSFPPYSAFIEVWNEKLKGLVKEIRKLDDKRKTALKARWLDEMGKDFKVWEEFCGRVAASKFLIGDNDRGWKATIDWALRPSSITKTLEGQYEQNETNKPLTMAEEWQQHLQKKNLKPAS